jgi:hypothetical protein
MLKEVELEVIRLMETDSYSRWKQTESFENFIKGCNMYVGPYLFNQLFLSGFQFYHHYDRFDM